MIITYFLKIYKLKKISLAKSALVMYNNCIFIHKGGVVYANKLALRGL